MNPFNYRIRLRIAGGDQLLRDTTFVLDSLGDFAANSLPLSMMISVGHGHRVSQVISSVLAMKSAWRLGVSTISNHPVAGSIIVTQ